MDVVTNLLLALPPVTPVLHLGSLHPFERALVLLVAFGPFVVLGVVVFVVRRRDLAAEEREAAPDRTDEGAQTEQTGERT